METHEPLLPLWAMELLFEVFIYAWLFCLGATVGSFLNVVVYRLPRRKSLVYPGSYCPRCGHAIRLNDNIPLLSWLLLGGRCRDCRSPISPRYFFVELATALIFLSFALVETKLQGQSPWRFGRGLALRQTVVPFWFNYLLHVGLLTTLLGAALIDRDGFQTPTALFAPLTLAALITPLVFTATAPAAWWLDWGAEVLARFLGLIVGAGCGVLVGALWRVGSGSAWPRFAPIAMLAAVGVVVGRGDAVLISTLGTLLFAAAIFRLRFLPGMVVVPFAGAMLLAATPYLLLPLDRLPALRALHSIPVLVVSPVILIGAALASGRFASPVYFAEPPADLPADTPPAELSVSAESDLVEPPQEPTATP